MDVVDDIVRALRNEHADLDALLAGLERSEWDRSTPADGWAVRDQISHLAYFDEQAVRSIVDPHRFEAHRAWGAAAPEALVTEGFERGRAMTSDTLIRWLRDGQAALVNELESVDRSRRLAWYGPAMSPASFATARLMEVWAHTQDIVDGLSRPRTSRTATLRHVAELAVRTLPHSFRTRGEPVPDTAVRVEVTAPDGVVWTWGDAAARDRVVGDAEDLCLVATKRRHVLDTKLRVTGPGATRWMQIAQTFAGPPGTGREPGQFGRPGGSGDAR